MPPEFDAQRLIDETTAARDALLSAARGLSESRIYGRTARAGWTLKHELSAVAAADRELVHLLGELARDVSVPPEGFDLRRGFGEAMHAVQELRLNALIERLEAGGAEVARGLGEHGAVLERPLRIVGREVGSMAEVASAHLQRMHDAVATIAEHS
jgi:hypothetical protein